MGLGVWYWRLLSKRHIPSVGVYVGDFFFARSFHGSEKEDDFMFTVLDMSTLIIVPFTDTIVNEDPNISHGACAMEDIPKTLSNFNEEIWLKNSISLFINNNT